MITIGNEVEALLEITYLWNSLEAEREQTIRLSKHRHFYLLRKLQSMYLNGAVVGKGDKSKPTYLVNGYVIYIEIID